MLNHFYSLLMNVDGAKTAAAWPGEELIDPAYLAVRLPAPVLAVRRVLFGDAPDRPMLAYRSRQLLDLVHATPLAEYVTALDPRITYETDGATGIPDFTPVASLVSGPPEARLLLGGRPTAPDSNGKMRHSLRVEALGDGRAELTYGTGDFSKTYLDLHVASGLSDEFALGHSGYTARLGSDVPQVWLVEILNRPERDLGQLAADLGSIGEPVLDAVLGIERREPYATFRNLWFQKEELAPKLGGLVCALVYRTEEARRA